MADTKISDLTPGGVTQAADTVAAVRAGGNVKVILDVLASGADASDVPFTPFGNIVATDADGAIQELDSKKAQVSHAHVISDTTDLQTSLDDKSAVTRTVVNEVATSRTFGPSDSGAYVRSTNASATVFTIDTNANQDIDVDTQIDAAQKAAGALTITAVAGVALNGVDGGSATLTAIHSAATLVQVVTDGWDLVGDHGGVS